MKCILLNLIYLNHDVGGAWNYTANFIRALPQSDNITYFAICNNQSRKLAIEAVTDSNITVVCSLSQSSNLLARTYFEFTSTRRYVKQWNIDAVHWFGNHALSSRNTICFITVHDLQPLENDYFSLKRWYHKLLYAWDATNYNNIFIPISDFTNGKLRSLIKPKVVTDIAIPNALPSQFTDSKSTNNQQIANHLPSAPYLLYVSHFYPHKNHIRLIEAFELIANESPDIQLVLRGDQHDAYEKTLRRIKSSGFRDRIILLPRLDISELHLVYQQAKGLIFPSLYEGGGIPVMEAYSCQLPVACSNLPVFNEFYENLPTYFDPTSVEEIKKAMKWLIDFEKDDEFIRRTEAVVSKFNISRNTRRLKKIYNKYLFRNNSR